MALESDAEGYLWVVIFVPALTWRDAWPRDIRPNATEIRLTRLNAALLFSTMIEVIDPSTGRQVTSARLKERVIAALPGRRFAIYAPAVDGTPQISIATAEIRRNN